MVFKTIALNHSATSPTISHVAMWRQSSYHGVRALSTSPIMGAAISVDRSFGRACHAIFIFFDYRERRERRGKRE